MHLFGIIRISYSSIRLNLKTSNQSHILNQLRLTKRLLENKKEEGESKLQTIHKWKLTKQKP